MHLQVLLGSLFFSLTLAISSNAFSSIQLPSKPGSTLAKRGQSISRTADAALSKRQTVWLGVSNDCNNCDCNLNSLNACTSSCALKCQNPQKCRSCRCDEEGNLCDYNCRICKPEDAIEPNQHCDACPFLCTDNRCSCFLYAAWGQCLDNDDSNCSHTKLSCGEYVAKLCQAITRDLAYYNEGVQASCSSYG